jgi:hypothetical protein
MQFPLHNGGVPTAAAPNSLSPATVSPSSQFSSIDFNSKRGSNIMMIGFKSRAAR